MAKPRKRPPHELGCLDAIRVVTRTRIVKVRVTETVVVNDLQIPVVVTEADLQELRVAGFEVSADPWGEPIAKAPGAPWFGDAGFELARLRLRRDRRR